MGLGFEFNPPVIGHRGACAYAPENTIASFLKAKQLGLMWVEFDIRLTADNELIIFHDDTLERTTNGKGTVRDCSVQYLQSLDAGSWFDRSFSGERIPSFKELILFLHQHQMAANIELKADENDEALLADLCIKTLEQYWTDSSLPFFISSFSVEVLKNVRNISNTYPLGFLMDEWNIHWHTISDQLNCICLDVNADVLTAEKIAMIHSTKRQVLSYTVNNQQQAKALFAMGVDAVFSDAPDQIIHY